MSSAEVQAIDSTSFNAYVSSASGAVLVDFWAPWCGPCRGLAPHLEQLAKRFTGEVQIRKLNVDSAPELAASFGVRSIPTLILFKDGKPHSQRVGMQSEVELSAWVRSAL